MPLEEPAIFLVDISMICGLSYVDSIHSTIMNSWYVLCFAVVPTNESIAFSFELIIQVANFIFDRSVVHSILAQTPALFRTSFM